MIELISLSTRKESRIDEDAVVKQATALVDKPSKASIAHCAGEARRDFGDDLRSTLNGFVGRFRASVGGVK